MKLLARFLNRYAGSVSLAGLALSIVCGYYSVQLYKNLRTEIEELLPTTARSIIDLNEVTSRLASFENMVVLVFSKDTVASKRFVDDLATKLHQAPPSVIASVEHRIDKEIAFFKQRRSLFIELEDLIQIRNYIRDRINYEIELYNPLTFLGNVNVPEPLLDLQQLRRKYETKSNQFDHLPDGYYARKDETMRLVIVYMPGKNIETSIKLSEYVRNSVKQLNSSSYASDLEVKYTGNVQNMIEETAALVADLASSTIIVVLLVAFAMWFFYRSLLGTIALNVSLFMGTFYTFCVAYFAVGYLNANTAFLASIVIGNGINFGIILLARYFEDRRAGHGHLSALESSMSSTATSTGTAALAAGLAYGSLILTGFRGFNQFGVIGFAGMILCWASSYILMPAFLTLIERWKGDKWINFVTPKPILSGFIANLVDRHAKLISIICLVLTVAAVMTFPKAKNGVIETNLKKLGDKESLEHGSGSLYHHIKEVFNGSVSPMVILPRDRQDARKIAEVLREMDRKDGANSIISTVQTLDDFVPEKQKDKILVLSQISKLLKPEIMDHLQGEEKKMVKELLAKESQLPFVEEDLPELVKKKFRENDGRIGNIVLLDRKFYDSRSENMADLERFIQIGRRAADIVKPGTPVAGQLPVSYDLFKAIEVDGPKATFFAFLAVIILVIVLFRHIPTIAQTLFSLIIGMIWLAGLMLGFGIKINFLNFIALPITFGIGVDYGVNILQRYREVGAEGIVDVVRNTGGAVMLASLTTIIGYGSLLIAGNQAFVSFGLLAVLGELTCVVAAVVALPAFLRWRHGPSK
ncbi:MAG: MMPL family transporter [Xanthomonadaceae bacterium]|nr:MMPL family transporter [Xanthomonadaceae bacterium]